MPETRGTEYTYQYSSPLGGVTLASDGERLTGLWFDGQKHFAATLSDRHEERPLPVFAQTAQWLDVYFSGREPAFTPPLLPKGTAFQQAVWALLLAIPYGQTTTYQALADRLAGQTGRARTAARAVGNAVGRNPISLIIPCHRVLGADGSLTGYAGGVDKKERLLALERGVEAGWTCRPARPTDAPELFRLNERFNGAGSNSLRAIAESLRHNGQEIVCVAARGETLGGFCCGQIFKSMCYDVDYGEITELFVAEDCRRQGVGSALMAAMEAAFKRRGIEHYQLFTGGENEIGQAFYQKQGYLPTDEIMYRKRPKPPEADESNGNGEAL